MKKYASYILENLSHTTKFKKIEGGHIEWVPCKIDCTLTTNQLLISICPKKPQILDLLIHVIKVEKEFVISNKIRIMNTIGKI